MPPRRGSKQERGRDRREQILKVAEEMLLRDGHKGMSLAAIGEEIGISAPGVLHHFETKEGLLEAILENQLARYEAIWDTVAATSDVPVLKRLPKAVAAVMGDVEFLKLWAVLVRENLHESSPARAFFVDRYRSSRACLRNLLKEGQERGEISPNIDLRAKAAEIVAFEDGIMIQWLLDPWRVPLVEMYERYTDDLVRSLRAEGPAQARPVAVRAERPRQRSTRRSPAAGAARAAGRS